MLIALVALSAVASQPAWDALAEEADWKELGAKKSSVGEIEVRAKRIDGVACLEGGTVVDTSPEQLVAVTRDMARSIEWSSADLAVSEELANDGETFVLFQYYDAPGWTLAADRYWVVRGEPKLEADRGSYRWTRVDAGQQYPAAEERAQAMSRRVIELPANYGEWTFVRTNAGTEVRYRACADFGGRLPTGVQQWLNTQQLPALVADLVTEANRR